uniref:Uncharacterized protein n=1 Tax=Bicyclus anynana TaxID=110368 RepID=A0A1C9EGG8_BICAN|nr:hypothetical protein [Bicyclus anynana]
MLNKAKSQKSTAETVKRTKRTKKQTEDKPTLIVCKRSGQYHVELKATPDNPDECTEQCTPLIYKIESDNNKVKIKKRDKIQKRLIKAAVNEVWSDPYQPEACEDICLPAYQRAMGVFPESGDDYVPNKFPKDPDSCSCDDEEISSTCNSSEVEWEIHFTPPIVSHQIKNKEKDS